MVCPRARFLARPRYLTLAKPYTRPGDTCDRLPSSTLDRRTPSAPGGKTKETGWSVRAKHSGGGAAHAGKVTASMRLPVRATWIRCQPRQCQCSDPVAVEVWSNKELTPNF